MCRVVKMEEAKLPRERVFFGNAKEQYRGVESKEKHGLRYHLYLIPEGVDGNHAVVYGKWMHCDVHNKFEVLSGNVDRLYIFDDKVGPDYNVTTNSTTVVIAKEEGESTTIDVLRDYYIYALIQVA